MGKRGMKKGGAHTGSIYWRLLRLKPGESMFTHQKQSRIWRSVNKASLQTGDKYRTQDVWVIPLNRNEKPEVVTKVTRGK